MRFIEPKPNEMTDRRIRIHCGGEEGDGVSVSGTKSGHNNNIIFNPKRMVVDHCTPVPYIIIIELIMIIIAITI